jgi:2-polyprenyl-3-methyl-5-hydroxy-6-metoxy-1,4-benzoquinol methylase
MNTSIKNDYYWDIANSTFMGKYLTEIENTFISEYLSNNGYIKNILDVGGGSGRIAIPLSLQGYHITVTEIDLLPLQKLKMKKRDFPVIYVRKSDKSFPFKSASFDCILCLQVLSLTEHSDWFYEECHRNLKKHGTLIFTMLNRNSYKGILRHWRLKRDITRGEYWKLREYSKTFPMIRSILKKTGFSIIKTRGYNWIPAKRSSNHWFIRFLALIERIMCLRVFTSLSPWLIIAVKKND